MLLVIVLALVAALKVNNAGPIAPDVPLVPEEPDVPSVPLVPDVPLKLTTKLEKLICCESPVNVGLPNS